MSICGNSIRALRQCRRRLSGKHKSHQLFQTLFRSDFFQDFFNDISKGFLFRCGEHRHYFSGHFQVKFMVIFETGFPFRGQLDEKGPPVRVMRGAFEQVFFFSRSTATEQSKTRSTRFVDRYAARSPEDKLNFLAQDKNGRLISVGGGSAQCRIDPGGGPGRIPALSF